ncbi:MAG: hypothetical protein QM710_03260 [Flavobacterium sp.]
MKIGCYILILLLLVSCKKEPVSFESIELAYDSGWAVRNITVISNDGTVKRITGFSNDGVYPVYSFIDTLSIGTLDSISNEITKLKKTKLQSLYKTDCMDCGNYSIKIKTKKGTIRCVIKGIQGVDNDLSKLCSKISNLKITKNRKINTDFDYETVENLMERLQFIRPGDSSTQQNSN